MPNDSLEESPSWLGTTDSRGARAAVQMKPVSWSSVLVEELMETNVIDGRNMAILKEQCHPVCLNDPSLLMDLRHNKMVRASLQSSKSPTRSGEVMAEAKRILSYEVKDQKKTEIQNKIVDGEIKKFQDHIVNLRKMNRRLERLTYSSSLPKRKVEKGRIMESHICQSGNIVIPKKASAGPKESQGHSFLHPIINAHNMNKPKESTHRPSKPHSPVLGHKTPFQKGRAELLVCGNKLEEHDNLMFYSDPSIHGPVGRHYSIFEQLHHRYEESERLEMAKSRDSHIRHPSPINIETKSNLEVCSLEPMTLPSPSKEEFHLQTMVLPGHQAVREKCHQDPVILPHTTIIRRERENLNNIKGHDTMVGHHSSSQANTIIIDEWNAPATHMSVAKKFENKPPETQSLKPYLQPSSSAKNIERAKLDSMSSTYTKWMKNVCEEAHSGCGKEIVIKEKKSMREKEMMKSECIRFGNREEKIAKVLQTLQKNKTKSNVSTNEENPRKGHQYSKSVNDLHDDKLPCDFKKTRRVVSGSYEHRLNAQKDIIIQQKAKLQEQRKQIEEFKLSQLQLETEKSRMQAQSTVNYVLQSCNDVTKAHAKPLQSSLAFVDLSPGNVFVEKMEQRALEQRHKRLLSLERRKQFEEQWKLKIKEEEEKRRHYEEELMRKRNEEMQEMRKIERLAREEARKERERMIVLEKKADTHSSRRRLKNSFLGFKKLVILRKQQAATAEEFYEQHLMLTTLKLWKKHIDQMIIAKMSVAYDFYKLTLMRHCFAGLMKEQQLGMSRMQVAVDIYEFRLQDKYFHFWLQVTKDQFVLYAAKVLKAEELYCKILLKRVFGLWQKLPKVAQEEREKERRKTLLRTRVQQFLPDYRPTISSD